MYEYGKWEIKKFFGKNYGYITTKEIDARMKDYYDIYFFLNKLKDEINVNIFRQALENTVMQRDSSEYLKGYHKILGELLISDRIHKNWNSYRSKTKYAEYIDFNDIVSLLIGFLNDNVKK